MNTITIDSTQPSHFNFMNNSNCFNFTNSKHSSSLHKQNQTKIRNTKKKPNTHHQPPNQHRPHQHSLKTQRPHKRPYTLTHCPTRGLTTRLYRIIRVLCLRAFDWNRIGSILSHYPAPVTRKADGCLQPSIKRRIEDVTSF